MRNFKQHPEFNKKCFTSSGVGPAHTPILAFKWLCRSLISIFTIVQRLQLVHKLSVVRVQQRQFRCVGFSLVETLVAITILLIVIVGPLSISSESAQSTSFSSEQVVAFFLAQEGAELAQKARDDLMLRQFLDESDSRYLADSWSPFVNPNGVYRECYEPAGCGLEILTDTAGSIDTPLDCGTLDLCRLYYDDNTGAVRSRYTHTAIGNERTIFTRIIYFEPEGPNQVKVVSSVIWRSGFTAEEQEVSVETYLFNLYEN